MTVDELQAEARTIWGEQLMQLDEIAVAMGVIYGDICRQARRSQEGLPVDDGELKKEIGNLVFSTIRWCQDLGFDASECLQLAKEAQRRYATRVSQDASEGNSGRA